MAQIHLDSSIKVFLKQPKKLFIGGAWRSAQNDEVIDVINPADTALIGKIARASEQDVDAAVTAARAAFESGAWTDMKPAERARMIYRISDQMEKHAEELAQLETLDNGKPIKYARGDVMAAIGAIRYFAGWADKINGSTHNINLPGEHHVYTRREPVGVVAMIVPWNYPIVMAAQKLGPALAAGCTCVLKPAEDTSLSALRLAELIQEVGLPDGVFNLVSGFGYEAGAMLAQHPGIDKIAFTGSTATGKTIARMAADSLKKVSLELGGKSPNIIMPDADLDKAIPGSALGIFFNSGQTCTAPSRLYAHKDVFDEVVNGIADMGASMRIAPGLDEESDLGPLVSQKQLGTVARYVELAVEGGSEVVRGGKQPDLGGYFFEPTVISNTNNSMKAVREEIFGPVLVVQPFSDIDQVVGLANDSDYGLAASIWTTDLTSAHMLAKRISAGIIAINSPFGADWDVPIGGYKQSGIGRENGVEGLSHYLRTKAVFTTL